MAVSAVQYPAYVAAVQADITFVQAQIASVIGLSPLNVSYATYLANRYNRDQALLGAQPYYPPFAYTFPSEFATISGTFIMLPAGTPVPPLSDDLATQVTVGSVTVDSSPPGGNTITWNAPPPTSGSGGGSGSGSDSSGGSTTPTAQPLSSFYGGSFDYCIEFPDDPLCQLFGPSIGQQVNVTETTQVESITIVQQGLSGTDVAGIVNGALGDLWDATVGAVDAVVAEAAGAIQKAITALGNAINAAWQALSRLAGFILNLLQQLLDQVVKGILGVLQDVRNLLGDLYKKVLMPIVQGMGNLRQLLMDVYQRFLRPMLLVLQDIRQVLSILAAFHLKFAQKLDSAIADLEARITRPLFYLLSFVNGVANWVNLIITAGYLLQKSVFLNSLAAYVGEALNLQLNAMSTPPDPAAIAAAQQANQVTTAAQASADFNAFVTSDSGPMPAGLAPYSAELDAYLAQGVS